MRRDDQGAGPPLTYLDHNAAAPLLPEARDAMRAALEAAPGNPASAHAYGRAARALVEEAARRVKDLLGGPGGDIRWTGSGTEAVATALLFARPPGRHHLVTSAIEHPAGLEAAQALDARGWTVTRVGCGAWGAVAARDVAAALRPETALVSVLHANNETGVIQPVEEIAACCRERGVPLHVDAVQSAGKIPVRAESWGADFVSVAAHKLGGPLGVGALWTRRAARLAAPRGGTLNVPGIVGFGRAAALAAEGLPAYAAHVGALRRRLESDLPAAVCEARLTAPLSERLPNTAHFTFPDVDHPDLVLALDLAGFAVSAGPACRSGAPEPSHVLLAMGMSPRAARTAVRVSLGPTNTMEEIAAFTAAAARVVAGARPRVAERT